MKPPEIWTLNKFWKIFPFPNLFWIKKLLSDFRGLSPTDSPREHNPRQTLWLPRRKISGYSIDYIKWTLRIISIRQCFFEMKTKILKQIHLRIINLPLKFGIFFYSEWSVQVSHVRKIRLNCTQGHFVCAMIAKKQ